MLLRLISWYLEFIALESTVTSKAIEGIFATFFFS
jgi:hypothetical protein